MNGLKYVLLMKDIPFKTLAAELSVSPQLITAWCQGKKTIPPHYFKTLSDCLGVEARLLNKDLTLNDKIQIESQLNPEDVFAFDVSQLHQLMQQNQQLKQKHTRLLEVLLETDQELKTTQLKLEQIQSILKR